MVSKKRKRRTRCLLPFSSKWMSHLYDPPPTATTITTKVGKSCLLKCLFPRPQTNPKNQKLRGVVQSDDDTQLRVRATAEALSPPRRHT